MPIKLRMNYNMSKNGLTIIICNLIVIKLKLWSYEKNTQGGHNPPPLLPNSIETVDSLKILGVTLQCDLSFSDHINNILIESNRIIYTRSIYFAIMVPNSLSFRRFSELESCLAFCMHPPLGGDIYLRRTELESTLFWTNLKNSTCTLQMVLLSMICVALLMIDYSIK